MKIRTQLVLACFLLSIVPLSVIVLYSYRSSREALEKAYESEAARTTRQIDRRLAAIHNDLQERLAEVSALPLHPAAPTAAAENSRLAEGVMMALGDTAKMVDSLELRPMASMAAPVPPIAPAHTVAPMAGPTPIRTAHADPKPQAAPAPQPAAPAPAIASSAAAESAASADAASASTAVAAMAPAPMVIDIPEIPKVPSFSMSEQQREQMHELGRIATKLAANSASMSEAERATLEKQMNELQHSFNDGMVNAQKEYSAGLEKTLRANEAVRRAQERQRSFHDAERLAGLQKQLEKTQRARERLMARMPKPGEATVDVSPDVSANANGSGSSNDSQEEKIVVRRTLSPGEAVQLREHQKRVAALFGNELTIPVRQNGQVVANLSAQLRLEEVIKRVLGGTTEEGEIAFAVDRDHNVYTRNATDRMTLDSLGVTKALAAGATLPNLPDWIVAISRDAQTGMRIGAMRPVSSDLAGLRRAAAVNFSAGIALIVVALIGIVPVANHITRDVNVVTAGAERIALGDLTTRVPVKSQNEFGQLATAFNKMAADLSRHQQTIVEQERAQKEQELQQRMLEMEYSRKSVELEDARRFQLSMLPKELPLSEHFDVAVSTETATEVGGDYYDFHTAPDGTLSIAIGDATGHGAKAGTMITVAKTLFSSYTTAVSPAAFLGDAAEKIKRMDFTRMAMSLLLARFEAGKMTIAAAGMPPTLIHRAATGSIEEITFESTPLGTIGRAYGEHVIDVASGDTVLFMTDGFPELLNEAGMQLGYPAAVDAVRAASASSRAADVIAALVSVARTWRGSHAPNDDITFVAVRVA